MTWIEIDRDNLPEGEVLAACFDKTKAQYKTKYIGHLAEDFRDDGFVYCNKGGKWLGHVTHWMPLPELPED